MPESTAMQTNKIARIAQLAFAILLSALPSHAQTTRPDAEKHLAREIYKEMVEVQSGFTTGATTPIAESAAARLKAAGFPESDIFVGGAIPRKANLVVRYHGTGARKPILLLAHIDVVEARREDWSMDPFEFVEKDGYFYGRGTGDDKAQAAIWLANLIQYKKEGFKPDRDIIVALTADEEGGGPYNGVDWLIKNHRDLIDADFALNEGGWGEMIGGKRVANYLQVAEKYVINFRFEVRNKGGHSSLPVRDNAIYHLAGALQRLSDFGFPLKTDEITSAYFQQMAKLETGPLQSDLEKTAASSREAMERVAASSPAWNSTLRTTCVATMVEGGHAMNALPQLAAATVNCRVLPEDSADYVETTLRKIVADDRVSGFALANPESAKVSVKRLGEPTPGPASPLRPDLLDAARRVTEKLWPGVPVVPDMVMGATDGRSLRIAGIPCYGIQGIFIDRDDVRFHGRDERILVQSFFEGQAFLYDLVKSLSTSTQ
jgi:acetylornithine deacetylase/succinyl-diaminopimelate desuccinylase-like protein